MLFGTGPGAKQTWLSPMAIPLDVLEVIFGSVRPHDLAACARVSRAVGALAHQGSLRSFSVTTGNGTRTVSGNCFSSSAMVRGMW